LENSFQSKRDEDTSIILDSLDQSGYVVTDLSSNEMAKVHGRYLCGGRSSVKMSKTEKELLYRYGFDFSSIYLQFHNNLFTS